MGKIRKAGIAIVMGLLLSLTLLVSGTFAADTTAAQNVVGASTQTALLTGNSQQEARQMLHTSHTQLLAERTGAGRSERSTLQGDSGRVRCRWVRRGWGRWRRWVRICRRWW